MKYLIFILIYIFCFNAFSCPEITGKWICSVTGVGSNGSPTNSVPEVLSPMQLSLTNVGGLMTFHIEADGDPDSDNYILDGKKHTDKQGLSYIGECEGNVIKINGIFPNASGVTKVEYLTHFISYMVDGKGPYISWTVDSNFLSSPRVIKIDCRQQF